MPKDMTPMATTRRHKPLEDDILATGPLTSKPSKRKSRHDDEEKFVDSKASRKILRMGQELTEEDENTKPKIISNPAFDFSSRFGPDDEAEVTYEEYEAWGDEEDAVEEEELAPADLAIFSKFFPAQEDPLLRQGWGGSTEDVDEEQVTNLADLILEKIAEHEASLTTDNVVPDGSSGPAPIDEFELHPKVIEVYTKCGLLLSRYKSGKLPKPFKILPTVPNWEEILAITQPDKWTPNACYEATKIFVSGTPHVAQHFLEMVLLERVRDDIHETKKLNVHLFKALKKSLYKPAAFFKGFLFPLVRSGTCTLREAHIISAVLARVSIPVLHSAAALCGLCDIAAQESSADTEGGGATNIFIKTLLEKKYALPYQAIDSLVFHFLRFRTVDSATMAIDEETKASGSKTSKLPVIWHQCLLAFAQRYRNDITEDQREALLDLLLTKGHSAIGPEVRRELLEGRGRGVPIEPEGLSNGDDTMMGED